MIRRGLPGTNEPLRGTRFDGEIPLDFLPANLREEVALSSAKAGVVEGSGMRSLSALELIQIELSLERGELGVCEVREGNKMDQAKKKREGDTG